MSFRLNCLFSVIYIAFISIVILAGCSTAGGFDAVNPADDAVRTSAGGSSHTLWGLWQFTADPEAGTLDMCELRSGLFHLNALPFLEPPPLVFLSLESLEFDGNFINVEIGIRHPFLGLTEFTGFDVCGILITNGSIADFTDPDLRMAGPGDMRLLNADGYSRWWNPAEFPHDGTMFGYKDGLLGAPDSYAHYNSTVNGYKYFCDHLDPKADISTIEIAKRGMFMAGGKNVRMYNIELGTEGLIFNYAVDACWEFPQGNYPWTAPDDFSPNANRPEPYRLSISEIDKTLIYDPELGEAEGEVTLLIDVYDWFGAGENTITVECGDIFTPITTDTPVGGGLGYSTYQVDILDAQPTTVGPIDLFITAACPDVGYQDFIPGAQVSSYFTYTMLVPEGQIQQGFPCGKIYWEDDFDFYSNGQYPLPYPWVIFWSGFPAGCRVTNEQAYSPPHSWRASDQVWWARYDAIPMTAMDHFCYEGMVMLTSTGYPAKIGFAWKTSGSTTGHFCAYTISGADYTPYQWYHIYAEIDCIENKWQLWIDDVLKVDSQWTEDPAGPEYTFNHFFIGTTNHPGLSGYGVVYWDDIRFWVDG